MPADRKTHADTLNLLDLIDIYRGRLPKNRFLKDQALKDFIVKTSLTMSWVIYPGIALLVWVSRCLLFCYDSQD